MLEKQTRTIGEYEYEVTQLDAVRGRRVFTRFAKLMMPALAEVTAGVAEMKRSVVPKLGDKLQTPTEDDSVDTALLSRFSKALTLIAQNITEDDLDFFCDQFMKSTCVRRDGKAPKLEGIFALHFAGKYDDMLAWLLFCFEVNFGSFFDRLGLTRAT